MSGGHFEYRQYNIELIADEIEKIIENNNSEEKDEWGWPLGHNYSKEVIEKFKEGVYQLRKAFIYAQRIDWLVSGDDDEESFLERLEQELKELEEKENGTEK